MISPCISAELIRGIREKLYHIEYCEYQEKEGRNTGTLVGFVLLNTKECDFERIKKNLKADWKDVDWRKVTKEGSALVFEVDDMMLCFSYFDAPVPDKEAEYNAENNYLWPEAVEVTKTHVAQLCVAVLSRNVSIVEAGELFVKGASSCLKLANAIGFYASGTVFEPKFYIEASTVMKEDTLPILNWIYFGFTRGKQGPGIYTYGMTAFGKDELEILDSRMRPEELSEFLYDVVYYILESDVTLRDGETIGMSEEQKLAITRSEGVSVDGFSLKIALE